MANGRAARLRAGSGSMSDWLTDRRHEIADRLSDFYASEDGALPAKGDLSGAAEATVRRYAREKLRQGVGTAGLVAGGAVGLKDGVVETAKGVRDAAGFAVRILNPLDSYIHPRGEAAWDQVFDAAGNLGGSLVELGARVVSDPRGALADGASAVRDRNRELNPYATPAAPTLRGEFLRNKAVGRNDARLFVELAPYALGAGEIKALVPLSSAARAAKVQKYIRQGFPTEKAEYLAQPYSGVGHHSGAAQRTRLPAFLGGGPVPRAVLDSPFNVVKPPNITRGDFYELHYGVDPHFYGTRLNGPPRKGAGWSGRRVGAQRYGTVERLWYGTPNATKRAGAAVGVIGGNPFGTTGEE